MFRRASPANPQHAKDIFFAALFRAGDVPHAAGMPEAQHLHPPATQAELDRRFRRPLMAYFVRRVSSPAEAEDLTQDVFERVLKMLTHESVQNAEALVFRIAVNLLRDRARRQRSHGIGEPLPDDATTESLDAFAVDFSPERVVMGERSLEQVHEALCELGDRTRAMFYLYRLENLKVREIAAIYGISASAVEKQLGRALLHLTQRLRGD
jgi:RNA polymerase sigma-70 factor (ECF subfamily)